MIAIFQIIHLLLSVLFYIMLAHVILSWLINFQVLNLRQPVVAQIWDGLSRFLEPIYAPVRRMLPATGGIDFAPLVVFLGIIILRDILLPQAAAAVL